MYVVPFYVDADAHARDENSHRHTCKMSAQSFTFINLVLPTGWINLRYPRLDTHEETTVLYTPFYDPSASRQEPDKSKQRRLHGIHIYTNKTVHVDTRYLVDEPTLDIYMNVIKALNAKHWGHYTLDPIPIKLPGEGVFLVGNGEVIFIPYCRSCCLPSKEYDFENQQRLKIGVRQVADDSKPYIKLRFTLPQEEMELENKFIELYQAEHNLTFDVKYA